MSTNIIDSHRSQTIKHGACALYYLINKATKKHSVYVTLDVFHGNDSYTNATKSYVIRTSTVLSSTMYVVI